jgi:chromatin remodeling complex protein RSC6
MTDKNISAKKIKELEKKVSKLTTDLSDTRSLLEQLKKIKTEVKITSDKKNNKKIGLASPIKVPNTIKKLLNITDDVKRSKLEITHLLYEYIDEKKLKNENNNRIINPNKSLMKLFNIKKNEKMSFDNFQQFLSRAYNESQKNDESSQDEDSDSDSDAKPKKKAQSDTSDSDSE